MSLHTVSQCGNVIIAPKIETTQDCATAPLNYFFICLQISTIPDEQKCHKNHDSLQSHSSWRPVLWQYSMNNSQQKAINNAILSNLVIDCNLPLSIVENKRFRHFSTAQCVVEH